MDSKKSLLSGHNPVSYQSLQQNDEPSVSDGPEKGLSTWEMIMLTICMAGMQFTWTVELSYGTPYLTSLGLSRELTALVWLAGPLSGLLIQPIVGAYSDKSTFQMGRRRPFIITGGFLVCLSIVMIAYCKEWASFLLRYTHPDLSDNDKEEEKNAAILIAVIAFYFLDFSLNAVMASCRALILDIPPLWQQELGSAWAARMIHIGNIVGYFTGQLDLVRWMPLFLGGTQMKGLCFIAIVMLILSLLITCLSVNEKIYESVDERPWYDALIYIYRAFRFLPTPIQRICNVQFSAWMGWFPFLFYGTTWIIDVYKRTHPDEDPDVIGNGTRAGSLAMFYFALVSILSGIFIPQLTPTTFPTRNPFTIYNIYTISHILVAIILLSTFFVDTVLQAMAIITLLGIPWAVSQWVPYALIGEFVSVEGADNADVKPVDNQNIEEPLPESSTSGSLTKHDHDDVGEKFDAGMILGVHNMYIVFPQFVTALISFAIFQIAKAVNHGDDGVGWLFRFCGFVAIIAAILSTHIIHISIERNLS